MSLHTGDTLGPYEITGVLGKGGMGEVYRARDPRLKRDVAIKVAGTAFSERFQRELFFRANDASNTMWSVDVSRTGTLGTPHSLFRAPVMGAGGFNNSPNYEVSRDGRRILAVVNAEAARDAPLTVIVNWKAARP